ncbi:MAG: hypothetical protein J6D18_04430, partial [Erysipelotrichaceae bacterium]|nr:hypothetical protein [Erysipelotrichaceae bacterium]
VALEQILIALKKKNKKVLVCIDEVSNTKNIRTFIHSFQILIRKECPLFLLMTGLYENIYTLQNDKSLTFLYRAPKIELAPLNIGTIAANYQTNFRCSDREALEMARLTKGYSFAFQVLGYLRWNQKTYDEQTRLDFKQYLEDYVYEKIWMECSGNDQAILYAMAKSPTDKIADIRSQLNIDTNAFNPYRQRLIRKGLVNGSVHSHLTFTLPYFDRFVLEHYNL